jgi:hypothetical protein
LNTRYFSSKQEKSVAKKTEGKVQPNSGATAFRKGDVKTDLFLLECKTAVTSVASMSIKKDWISKLREEAFAMRKRFSAVVFNFGPQQENFYIIDEKTFIKLQTLLREEEENE